MQKSNSDVLFSHASIAAERDPWLRKQSLLHRLVFRYRQLPFVLRMSGIFTLGFVVGSTIELFACKTRLYESIMSKKEQRRHDLDEFVVDFREKLMEWQKEDMEIARQKQKHTTTSYAQPNN